MATLAPAWALKSPRKGISYAFWLQIFSSIKSEKHSTHPYFHQWPRHICLRIKLVSCEASSSISLWSRTSKESKNHCKSLALLVVRVVRRMMGGRNKSRNFDHSLKLYSVLHNKPELPFFAKLVCVTLFWPKMEIQPLLQSFNQW